MQEGVIQIFEASACLIMDGGKMENDGQSRGTRGEVVVGWDARVVRDMDSRGYKSYDFCGERDGFEGIHNADSIKADGFESSFCSAFGYGLRKINGGQGKEGDGNIGLGQSVYIRGCCGCIQRRSCDQDGYRKVGVVFQDQLSQFHHGHHVVETRSWIQHYALLHFPSPNRHRLISSNFKVGISF